MKKNHAFAVAALCCGQMIIGSCADEVFNQPYAAEPDSRLTVVTRADGDTGGDEAVVASPVRIFVFDGEGSLAMSPTLDEGSTSFSAALPAGDYQVVAVGGLDDSRYALPETVTRTAPISLRDGQRFGDLMTASSPVTLTKAGKNQVTLDLERRVVLIRSVTISQVPESAQSVSVSISPLCTTLLLDGSCQGDNGRCDISLSPKADEPTTWQMTDDAGLYLLPSAGTATISVTIDNDSYTYTCGKSFDANRQISIEGTYTDNIVTLTGTVTGTNWAGEDTFRFSFDKDGTTQTIEEDSGSDDTGGSTGGETTDDNIPKVGALYQGCYVFAVDGNNVSIVASNEQSNIVETSTTTKSAEPNINKAVEAWDENGITNWRLPTESEIKAAFSILVKKGEMANNLTNVPYYFQKENGSIGKASVSTNPSGTVSVFTNTDTIDDKTILRPVATITFKNE